MPVMRFPSSRCVCAAAAGILFLLGACVQPTALPGVPTATAAAPYTEAAAVDELTDRLAAEFGITHDSARGVAAKQIQGVGGAPLFAAYTYGLPPDDETFMHKVSLHRAEADGWSELGRVELNCVNYTEEASLQQAQIGPTDIWLTVQGGAGAHGGCLELLRWDGANLTVVLSGFSSAPDAGSLIDLNGDGQLDLLLDNSDPYIFCYACGVRQYWAQLFYWDGQSLVEVTPTPLPADRSTDLRALNDRAVELAEASLFADALGQIEQAEAAAPEDEIVAWNAVWIRRHLEAGRLEATASPFPLLNHVFVGDWESAFDALWRIGLPAIASDAPFADDSAAFGFERIVGELLAQYSDTALSLQPDRAAVHALGAWGRFLVDRDAPAIRPSLLRAAELAHEDARYSELGSALQDRNAALPASPAGAPPPDPQALTEQLIAQYGMAQDAARNVAAQEIDSTDGPPLFVAFTYGLPPPSSSSMHMVSIHAAQPAGWSELSRVELECVNYLDAFSLEQVYIDPASVWIAVYGGAGVHGACLELLRWDGRELSLVISSFNSIPDAGTVTDLDGDGQDDLLLNNSDPYIFCYACGVQRYKARFFYWDGQGFAEAAPAALPDDYPGALRAMNDHALALAEASLYADALAQIEQAESLAPADQLIRWNALWIRHHLEVSRRLAVGSPFPLLNHVFAGDWESAFDALWTTGLPTFSSATPIPINSAAAGFEQTVGELLAQYADNALTFQPDRAAIHALGAWGRYLLDRADPAIHAGFRQAAELASEDSRYSEIASVFDGEADSGK